LSIAVIPFLAARIIHGETFGTIAHVILNKSPDSSTSLAVGGFQMKKALERPDLPERMQYTKYYEHDGMLRAYANRAMVMAMLFAALAIGSLGFAIYVRVQPPTVIRVNKDGESSTVRARRSGKFCGRLSNCFRPSRLRGRTDRDLKPGAARRLRISRSVRLGGGLGGNN